MKHKITLYAVVIICSSLSIFPQNKPIDKNESQRIESKIDKNQEINDLKNSSLKDKIENDKREFDEDIKDIKENLKEKIELYEKVFGALVLTILGVVGFLGYKTWRDINKIINENVDKYANEKIEKEIKEKITDDNIRKLLEEKSSPTIEKLLKELGEKAKKTIADIEAEKTRYEKLRKKLESKPLDLTKQEEISTKETLKEFGNALKKVKDKKDYNYFDWYSKGLETFYENNYKESITFYSKAIALRPDYSEAYNDRGVAYHKLNEHQKAIEDFNKAIEFKPDYSSALLNIIELYILDAKYDSVYEKLVQLGSIEKELKDEIIQYYLSSILNFINNRGTSEDEEKIDELLKSNPVLTYSFNEIEDWLKTSNLPETKKDKIKALTEKLKKYRKNE